MKGETEGSFVVCHGWFIRVLNCVRSHDVKVSGEALSADLIRW